MCACAWVCGCVFDQHLVNWFLKLTVPDEEEDEEEEEDKEEDDEEVEVEGLALALETLAFGWAFGGAGGYATAARWAPTGGVSTWASPGAVRRICRTFPVEAFVCARARVCMLHVCVCACERAGGWVRSCIDISSDGLGACGCEWVHQKSNAHIRARTCTDICTHSSILTPPSRAHTLASFLPGRLGRSTRRTKPVYC